LSISISLKENSGASKTTLISSIKACITSISKFVPKKELIQFKISSREIGLELVNIMDSMC
jgi:hypothetical protein